MKKVGELQSKEASQGTVDKQKGNSKKKGNETMFRMIETTRKPTKSEKRSETDGKDSFGSGDVPSINQKKLNLLTSTLTSKNPSRLNASKFHTDNPATLLMAQRFRDALAEDQFKSRKEKNLMEDSLYKKLQPLRAFLSILSLASMFVAKPAWCIDMGENISVWTVLLSLIVALILRVWSITR